MSRSCKFFKWGSLHITSVDHLGQVQKCLQFNFICFFFLPCQIFASSWFHVIIGLLNSLSVILRFESIILLSGITWSLMSCNQGLIISWLLIPSCNILVFNHLYLFSSFISHIRISFHLSYLIFESFFANLLILASIEISFFFLFLLFLLF